MSKPRVAIVGLGLIGTSIGLALRRSRPNFEVVGHDREPLAAGQARKMGAVDKTEWNLITACEMANLIVLAIPVSGIRLTLESLAPYLQPGCLLTDTATLKEPVVRWAEELLPDTVSFVGGDPVVDVGGSGPEAASADLFQGALYCLTPSATASPEAVSVVSDLVHILGAKPYFLDAAEHDGLMAGVEHLPAILAAALMQTAAASPSWREMRKLAGGAFQRVTELASDDAALYRDLCLSNGPNVLRWIDALVEKLQQLRTLVAGEDGERLEKVFDEALAVRAKWLHDKAQGHWEGTGEAVSLPSQSGLLQRWLGLGGGSR